MKKQILILTIFTLAILSGTMKSYAQQALTTAPVSCLVPTTIDATCSGNHLTPIAGVPYTYEVSVPTPVAGTKSFQWFVTKDPNFITTSLLSPDQEDVATSDVILATGTNYNVSTAAQTTMDVTWDYFVHDPAAPVFLVVYVENVDGTACTTDNIEVYIIKPMHSFTLDVENVGLDGVAIADGGNGPCAAPVASAIWDGTAGGDGELLMNYGVNYMYFMVTAANFNHSWAPSFQVSGASITSVAGDRTITAIDWQYSANSNIAGAWNATVVSDDGAGLYTGVGTTVPVIASNNIVGSEGECIVVRVTIDNGRAETIAPDMITFAADGVMYDVNNSNYADATLGDIHHTSGATLPGEACPWVDLFANDVVNQAITERPDINEVTPAAPAFIIKN